MRTGRFPDPQKGGPTKYGVLATANGSRDKHFMDGWSSGEGTELLDALSESITTHEGMFKHFYQPPAFITPDYDWKAEPIRIKDWAPNPQAENIDNLPGKFEYYYRMMSLEVGDICRYVLGINAPVVTGKLVYPLFRRSKHVCPHDVVDRKRIDRIMLSFDYGMTPSCLIATTSGSGGLIVLDEITTEATSIDGLIQDHLMPLLKLKYNRPQHLFVTGDPTGEVKRDVGYNSPEDVLVNNGFFYEPPPCGNNIASRLEGVRHMLSRTDHLGDQSIRICENCEVLIEGFESNYIYERTKNGVKDTPTKAHPVSDIHDCLQYLASVFGGAYKPKSKSATNPKTTKRWV
jgi:hypothetical protein